VNPGNSGGPVFDSQGQVIGVVTLRIPGKEELSFCIPVEELRKGMQSLATQTPKAAAALRSRHRLQTAYKNLSGGGAIYGLMLELSLVARTNPSNADIKEKIGKVNEAVELMEKSHLFNIADEARVARNDPQVAAPTRRKVGALADSFKNLKTAYDRGRGTPPINSIRALKSTHRKLVAELGSDLNIAVPEALTELMKDHLNSSRTLVTQLPSMNGPGSLRQRMWEGRGFRPPNLPGGQPTGPASRMPRRMGPLGPRGRFGR
jgi:serine protease Do